MTATTTASRVITGTEPRWCTGHYEPSPREAFHQHTFGRRWGAYDERLGLGLTRFDSAGQPGPERIEVQYSNADEHGSVSLSDTEATEFAGDVLAILATKKSTSSNRLVLFARLTYEVGRAFAAAVRYSRTVSPRTASPHNRSIKSANR